MDTLTTDTLPYMQGVRRQVKRQTPYSVKKTKWLQTLLQTFTLFAHQGLDVTDITIDNENATKDRHTKQRMTFNKLILLSLPKLVSEVA